MKSLPLALVMVALSASACKREPTALVVCPLVAYDALSVTARDSVSGALLPNAFLKALGTYTDSINVGSNLSNYPVALGAVAGMYAVSVQAPGYATWTRMETVTLSDPECGIPNQLSVTALMQRSP
jgi:hypothetical protein